MEEEADALLVACIQAHDDAPPVLTLPVEVGCDPQELSDVECFHVSQKFESPEKSIKACAGIYVTTDNQIQSDLAKNLREKLLNEYADTVFRPQIYSNPPERFPGGIHTIQLKENVLPHYQRPFQLTGERRKAMEDIVQKWIDFGKI